MATKHPEKEDHIWEAQWANIVMNEFLRRDRNGNPVKIEMETHELRTGPGAHVRFNAERYGMTHIAIEFGVPNGPIITFSKPQKQD